MPHPKALFLDRDGIINIDKSYLYKIEEFEFVEGIFELVLFFAKKNYLIFIVTNQSGIGRGYYQKGDVEILHHWLKDAFQKRGIKIAQIEYCPHLPSDNCLCRKPKTGMVTNILKNHSLNLTHSFMIGDKKSDIDFARNANIGFSVAIGDKRIKGSNFSFESVLACYEYIKEKWDEK